MTTSYGSTPPGITGTHFGGSSIGVRGDLVPSVGLDGAGYLYAGLSLPADAAKEVRGAITRWPAGDLVVYEDSSFTYLGDTDYALYQLYVDGAPSATDIGYGSGIGRFDFTFSGDGLFGGVTMDDVAPAGGFADGGPSGLSGGVALDEVDPDGLMAGYVEPAAPAPPPSSDSRSGGYSAGVMLQPMRERDPKEVRRLMRKKHDEAEVLSLVEKLFDRGDFDDEPPIQ